MDDDRVAHLLEEIRDLVQQQVSNSERALANQTKSIEKQHVAVELYRRVVRRLVLASVPLIILVVLLVVWLFRSPYFP